VQQQVDAIKEATQLKLAMVKTVAEKEVKKAEKDEANAEKRIVLIRKQMADLKHTHLKQIAHVKKVLKTIKQKIVHVQNTCHINAFARESTCIVCTAIVEELEFTKNSCAVPRDICAKVFDKNDIVWNACNQLVSQHCKAIDILVYKEVDATRVCKAIEQC
jgi:hypothetical protein